MMGGLKVTWRELERRGGCTRSELVVAWIKKVAEGGGKKQANSKAILEGDLTGLGE